ncbi:hypothetical protein V5O48_012227, partial [Marasmius crinis-equi]
MPDLPEAVHSRAKTRRVRVQAFPLYYYNFNVQLLLALLSYYFARCHHAQLEEVHPSLRPDLFLILLPNRHLPRKLTFLVEELEDAANAAEEEEEEERDGATEVALHDLDLGVNHQALNRASWLILLLFQLIKQLQHDTAPGVFQPAGSYDGKKNLYMPHLLDFGESDSATFTVPVASEVSTQPRPPKLYSIKLVKVAEINPEVLRRFVNAQQSYDEGVSTALMAMNVAFRQDPIMRGFAFNTRSFFANTPDTLSKPILGLQFGRGIFQSVRPTLGKVILNADITTGMFYQKGPLFDLCLGYLEAPRTAANSPLALSPSHGLPDRQRIRLQRFISGIRVQVTTSSKSPGKNPKIITIAKLTTLSARDYTFTQRNGEKTTVADYFKQTYNRNLQYPDVICAQTASGAAIPLELLTVLPGQIARKQVPPEVTSAMVEFSQLKPQERLTAITKGLQLLAHGQSEYVRNFGMTAPNQLPMTVDSRVIAPPRLQYGASKDGKPASVDPRNGSWNLVDKILIQPQPINRWTVVIFESRNRFPEQVARDMVKSVIDSFESVGMKMHERDPIIAYVNAQEDISMRLRQAGAQTARKHIGPDGKPI